MLGIIFGKEVVTKDIRRVIIGTFIDVSDIVGECSVFAAKPGTTI